MTDALCMTHVKHDEVRVGLCRLRETHSNRDADASWWQVEWGHGGTFFWTYFCQDYTKWWHAPVA